MAHLYTAPELPVSFVHNPKAGCSSVKMALWRAIDRRRGTATYDGNPHRRPGPWSEDRNTAGLGKETFAVVRHPFARLYSAYWSKIRAPAMLPDPSEAARSPRWIRLGLDCDPGFAGFVRRIALDPPARMDLHWAPQSLNLSVRIDRLFRLEAADVLSAYLLERVGEPLPAWRPASVYEQTLAEAFDPETTALAARIYAADFAAYGYEPIIAAPAPGPDRLNPA